MGSTGPKWTMILLSFPMMLGFLFFVLSYEVDSEELIYVGRLLTGTSFALRA